MRIFTDGYKDYGEWHLNKRHGCGKVEWADGKSYWGDFKDDKKEGYASWEGANGYIYNG